MRNCVARASGSELEAGFLILTHNCIDLGDDATQGGS